MRVADPLPPRWRSIFFLLGAATAIALLTQYLDRPAGGRRTSLDPPPAPAPLPLESPAPLPASAPRPSPAPTGETPAAPGRASQPAAAAREIPRLVEEMGRPVAVVSAQVIDPAGRPIPLVQAQLGEREAVSDSQGELVLPQKPADLVLRHPDYFPRVIDPELRRGIAVPERDSACERVVVVMFPGGRVAGRVVDPAGRPIARAEAVFDGEEAPAATSDSAGCFRSPILRSGVHHLRLQHPDYQRLDAQVSVPAGGGEVPFIASLRPGVLLEVRTVDAGGAPVPDAGIWLVRKERGGAEESRFSGRTGDDGRLSLRWNPADPHLVRVLAPGFREATEPLAGERVVLILDRAPLITGQVIERERGLAVRPLEVVLEIQGSSGFSRAPDRGILFRNLAAGKFRVGLPPFPGSYRVRAQAEGDLSGVSQEIPFDGKSDPLPVTLYLERRAALRGQVVAARPGGGTEPVPGARVELYRHDLTEALRLAYGIWFAAPPAPTRSAPTDAGGSFSFPDLTPAVYRVRVLHPDHADWLSAPVTIPLEAPLPCMLREGASLRGAVLGPAAAPEPGIPLVLASQLHPFTRFTRSDGSGRYEFRNLAEGSYLLFAGDPRAEAGPSRETRWSQPRAARAEGGSQAIAIRAGADVVFDVRRGEGPLGRLSGTLSADGAPLGGVDLRVIPAEGPELEVQTGPDGGFRVEGLEPGAYRVKAGGLLLEREFRIEGGRSTELPIALRTLSFEAVLIDGLRGGPLAVEARAEIASQAAPDRDPRRRESPGAARSLRAEGGRFSAAGLYPGRYQIRVEATGYVPYEGAFELAPDLAGGVLSRELQLRPGSTLRVAVVRADGEPFRGTAEAVLLCEGVEVHRSYGPIDGAVLLPVLPSGSYLLTIRTDRGSARLRLSVPGGEEVRARLEAIAPR